MNEILSKISTYNIFNYLLPGTLFATIGDALTSYRFVQDDIIIGLFLYYFLGLVISRVGSLLIEPFLKKIKFVRFADYHRYVVASKEDLKIDELSETNNTYRTLCALFVCLLVLISFEKAVELCPRLNDFGPYILGIGLFLMFLFSYRKQTAYVVKRVDAVSDER